MTSCVFCQIAKGEINAQMIYRDAEIICFLDSDPINIGHVLIVPVNHYLDVDDLPEITLQKITKISTLIVKILKEVFRPDGYSMMQNGGLFNEIGHYHMHVFPRFLNDGFGWFYGSEKSNLCNANIAQQLKTHLSSFGC